MKAFKWLMMGVSVFFIMGLSISTAGWPAEGKPAQELPKAEPTQKYGAMKKGPDLVVDKFWVETILPGKKMPNGKTADKKYLYFVWRVRNVGDEVSASTKLNVSCEVLKGPGPCPPVAKSYGVKTLWPRPNAPNDPSGGQTFWNETPFPAPTSSVKYQFTALVDPGNKVPEKDEGNNKLVSVFSSHSAKATKTAKLGQILKLREPKVVVESVAVRPFPLKAGGVVDLSVNLKNKGSGPSPSGYKYKITCKVLSGGPTCPVPNSTRTIPKVMEPGGTYSDRLLCATPAAAGRYRVSIFAPYNSKGRPSFSMVLEVKPKFKRGVGKDVLRKKEGDKPGLRRIPER